MKTSIPTVIILGASYAGLMACARLLHSKKPLNIIVIDGKSHFEQKIRLHETLTGQHTQTLALSPLLERRGVTFLQAYIEKIDIHSQQITLKNLPPLSYDYVIYALGSVPHQHIKGSTQFAHSLHNKQQVGRLESKIRTLAQQDGRIAVLGSGLTAIETCTELAATFPNLKISLISRQLKQSNLVEKAQQHLDNVIEDYGIHRHQGTIQAISEQAVILADDQKIFFDLCLDCTGMVANPVARHSQLAVDEQGRLTVDGYLRLLGTNNVFVAGDAARTEINGELIRMSCATAMPMGAQAGINVAALVNNRVLQAFNFGYFARFTSLGRKQAVVQFSDRADQSTRWVATDYLACLYKEWICKMTVAMIKWELITGLSLYVWSTSGVSTVVEPANLDR